MAEYFLSTKEFLEMFSVDCSRKGAEDFINLTELYSLALVFPEYQISFGLLVKTLLRERKISPLVFWSRIKRDLYDVLTADDDTLEAMGLEVSYNRNGADMSKTIAVHLADAMLQGDIERYRPICIKMRDRCLALQK